ncbi:HEAT repeat domain-containing protein [bacterium]|nr:HEAT repeat domain-containing protein [bacterium]
MRKQTPSRPCRLLWWALALAVLPWVVRAEPPPDPADVRLARAYRVLRFERQHPFAAMELIRDRLQDEEEALPGLTELAGHADPAVRTLAAMVLGEYGEGKGGDVLWRLIADENQIVRVTAAGAVVRLSRLTPVPARATGLVDERPTVRRLTAAALAGVGDESVESHLIDALRDQDELVRCEVVKALAKGSCATETAVPSLVEMLLDPSVVVRDRTASVLGQFESPTVVPPLLRALNDPDWHVRASAASSLGGWVSRQPNVTPPLVKTLETDEFALVRDRAADALSAAPNDEVVVTALVRAMVSEHRDARFHAREAIVRGRATLALPKLMEHRRHPEASVRQAVIRTFGQIGGDPQVPAVIEALDDPDPDVRRTAAVALSVLRPASAVNDLSSRADDDNPHVRAATARAMGELGDRAAVPKLVGLLRDENGYVRGAAAQALGKLGDRSAVAPLIAILSGPQPTPGTLHEGLVIGDTTRLLPDLAQLKLLEEKIQVVRALGDLRAPEAVDPLVEHGLNAEDAGLRAESAVAIGKIGESRAMIPLQEAVRPYYQEVGGTDEPEQARVIDSPIPEAVRQIREREARVRASVAWALGQLGDTSVVPTLSRSANDENSMVRDAAMEALAKIGEREEERLARAADETAAAP